MNNGAERRIRGRGAGIGPEKGCKGTVGQKWPRFFLFVAVSLLVHASVLLVLVFLPEGTPVKAKVFEITMESVAPPGPAGGGGEAPEAVKPPPEKEKEKAPVKEEVKIAQKPVEKKPQAAETKKAPEKVVEAAPPKAVAAQPGPGQGPAGGGKTKAPTGPVSVSAGMDFPFKYYTDALETKVRVKWKSPALMVRYKPRCVVFFRVDRMGRIKDAKIEESSNIGIYDRSALGAVNDANPLPPLPAGYKGDYLEVHCTFIPDGASG